MGRSGSTSLSDRSKERGMPVCSPEALNQIRARLSRSGVLFKGADFGRRAPLNGLLDIFEDEDADHAVVSFLDDLEAVCADRSVGGGLMDTLPVIEITYRSVRMCAIIAVRSSAGWSGRTLRDA
jgi:hypothetical protein